MSAKSSGDVRLREAFGEPGCPICRCLEVDGRRLLETILYEHVTDPDTRAALRAAWGFCNWHTWMLVDIGGVMTGSAILYEDLVGAAVRRVRHGRARATSGRSLARRVSGLFVGHRPAVAERYERRPSCPACVHSRRGEARYVETMLHGIGNAEFDRAYEASDGICLPHVMQTLERGTPARAAEELVARTLAKWQTLRDDLQRFVGKHDYRNREPFTDAEVAASRRAFETLVGRRAIFGSDLHPERRRGITRPRRRGA